MKGEVPGADRFPILPASRWPSSVRSGTVTFVRHGQKAGGGFSADLTEQGRRDAEQAGAGIPCRVEFFIASPSPRTVSTAECIRRGNGSDARIVIEEQLAEPGLGQYTELRPAMASFVRRILQIVDENGSSVTIATTHNYVIDNLGALFGQSGHPSDPLCGITADLGLLRRLSEDL